MIQPGWQNRTWPLLALVMIIYLWWLVLYWAEACAANEFAKKDTTGCLEFVLNRYQTLISALIALLGALLTIIYLHKQIQHSDDQEKKRIERQNYAARASLPLALSQIYSYGEDCLKLLAQANYRMTGSAPYSIDGPLTAPEIATFPISTLDRNIEFADNPAKERMADLIACVQVQRARLEGVLRAPSQPELASSTVDVFEILSIIDSLFPYSRRETAELESSLVIKQPISLPVPADKTLLDNFILIKQKKWDKKPLNTITSPP